MSTAELIYNKAQTLPEPAQIAVLHIVELLAQQRDVSGQPSINPGSAKGLVSISEDFDEPLADFEPYMKWPCCWILTPSSGLSLMTRG